MLVLLPWATLRYKVLAGLFADVRTIRILLIDQLAGAGENKIRIAESRHDQERVRVSRHSLTSEPRPNAALVRAWLPIHRFRASTPSPVCLRLIHIAGFAAIMFLSCRVPQQTSFVFFRWLRRNYGW